MTDYSGVMKLSIIIVVYRAEAYIFERMSQFLSNDLSDIQIVVVVCEDGHDKSAEICKKLLRGNKNASVIIQSDKGLSVARNTGLMAASGEYVFFMDCDDIILEPGFSELMEKLSQTASDAFVGKFALLQSNGKDRWPQYSLPAVSGASEARQVIYTDLPDSIWNVWRYVCRRDFLIQNELYFVPGLISEDVEWTPRMLECAEQITFVDSTIYGYFYNHTTQLSRRINPKRTHDINETVLNGILKYKNKPYGKAICNRLIRESFYSISTYCRFSSADRKKLRPIIDECVKQYHHSTSKQVRLFMKSRVFIPLYIWSAVLLAAKALRNWFKSLLGANKAWSSNVKSKFHDGISANGISKKADRRKPL